MRRQKSPIKTLLAKAHFGGQETYPSNQQDIKESTRESAAPRHIPLKLQAEDSADLDVFSALMQDALIPAPNLHFNGNESTFSIKANRFCWETAPSRLNHQKVFRRNLATLQFGHITRVQKLNFDQDDLESYYNLLAIYCAPSRDAEESPCYLYDLVFAGEARIRLYADDIDAVLIDSPEGSFTPNTPFHGDQAIQNFGIQQAILEATNDC